MITRNNKKAFGLLGLWRSIQQPNSSIFNVVPIGRGHSGKTNLINSIPRVLDTLPSGIRIGYGDLRHLNDALMQVRQTEQDLTTGGLPPTLERSFRSIGLFVDELEELRLQISDEIGQPITNTTSDSPVEQVQRFEEYVNAASQADVLWVMLSLPTGKSSKSLALFRDDLARYECWLSSSVRNRNTQRPVSVALVVTKLDSLFDEEHEARSQATDNWLKEQLLQPLVKVLRSGIAQQRVSRASIIPVSAFGFGNAQLIHKEKSAGTAYEDQEDEYILGTEASLDPYNVLTLLTWTFSAALENRNGERNKPAAAALQSDLAGEEKWLINILP